MHLQHVHKKRCSMHLGKGLHQQAGMAPQKGKAKIPNGTLLLCLKLAHCAEVISRIISLMVRLLGTPFAGGPGQPAGAVRRWLCRPSCSAGAVPSCSAPRTHCTECAAPPGRSATAASDELRNSCRSSSCRCGRCLVPFQTQQIVKFSAKVMM